MMLETATAANDAKAGELTGGHSPARAGWRSSHRSHAFSARHVVILAAALVLLVTVWCAPVAAAVNERAGWELSATHYPTHLPPGGSGTIEISVFNVGAASSSGAITVTDTLPAGVTATDAGELRRFGNGIEPVITHELWDCTGNGLGEAPGVEGATVITCTNDPENLKTFAGGGGPSNNARGEIPEPRVGIAVAVSPSAEEGSAMNRATIAGGGALAQASTVDSVPVTVAPPGFGFTKVDGWFSNADGTPDTQAGSHPYEATFTFDLATLLHEEELEVAGGEVRNIAFDLPPGFVGNPDAVSQCTRQQFQALACPNTSLVGFITAYFGTAGGTEFYEKLYNMVPPPGVAAEFASNINNVDTFLDSVVRSGSDYGITTHANNTPQRGITGVFVTLWGLPGDPSHNAWRGGSSGGCTQEQIEKNIENNCGSIGFQSSSKPFLTLPTACAGPQTFTIRANTWENTNTAEAHFTAHDSNDNPTGFTGCELLGFAPALTAAPDTAQSDTPTGLTVEVKPPVGGLEDPNGLSTSDIKDTTVTLPGGLVINPGQAAELQACQPGQDGLTTQVEKEEGNENSGPPSCPNASKVGTVKAKTPLLEGAPEKELEGNVYVMQSNPPHLKLLAAFSADGVNIKLVLNVELDERTGQVTTRVVNIPEFPVSEFKLSFSGGAQAALDTPAQCGSYTTTSDFSPWSSPFVADVSPSSVFSLAEGPGGAGCPSAPLPFAPTMIAGSTTDQAGGFTDFSLLLQRGDGQQRIERLQFKAPAGLGGMLSSVPLCEEPQAARGTCPASSRIGHASVASGPGPYPLVLPQPGEPELPIYLTGPYGGAPFGLSIVTPVLAGPFNLGTIVTRAKIEIDPHTAQITVTTDPLPQVVRGVPTDLRLVDSVIDRPGFMFNPTNCNPQEFSGTAWGTPPPGAGAGGPGASSPIGSHFGVGSCRGLEFAPKFSVSTSGRNSKANGASLTAKLAYPAVAQGTQANIGLVKVDLPKQLPSRLTTLQKACTLAQFEANPAGCPPASFIGHAIVHTPELPVPLTGPAIFVSHGGEAFPTLTMVLQGDGVTIDVVGSTFINKAGITSTTFKTVPDAPFSTFELTLPQSPDSALATNVPAKANYSLCGQKLTMPTEFVAQNGAVLNRSTPVTVTGCAKTKALTRAQKLRLALKACRKKHNRAKRTTCERAARKRYGAVKGRSRGKRK